MSYTDKTLSCRDCGQSFVFTAGEQEFHVQKGFNNSPSRCPDCRAAPGARRCRRVDGLSSPFLLFAGLGRRFFCGGQLPRPTLSFEGDR